MNYRVSTKIAAALLVISGLIIPSIAVGEEILKTTLEPDSAQDRLLLKSITYVYMDSFYASYGCLDSLIEYDPQYWPSYVFKAGVVYTEMNDNEKFDRVEYFQDLIDSALAGLDDFLERNPTDKWALFFKGTALGYRALYEGHHGSWVKAVLKGLAAGKLFSKAVEVDSTFYEAYLGLGSLNYWRSSKMGFITVLPFIPDKRDEGIEQIKIAMEKSRYSALPAASGLAWVYFNQKKYNLVIALMDSLINEGIYGRQVLWPEGLAQFKRAHAAGTLRTFTLIKNGLERKGHQNYYNIGLCNYYLGLANFWRGDYTRALGHLNKLLDQKVDKDVAKRLKKHYKEAEKYKKKIKKAVAAKLDKSRR
jgi:tetratricopeptide (TPR) repeat protein